MDPNIIAENNGNRLINGQFAPGSSGGPGRHKGSKNQFTHVKDYFIEALDELTCPP
jgi:hypothetical protein